VVPSAAGGSLMLTPEVSIAALRTLREKYGARIYGVYGFVDAFNPNSGWVDSDAIGINVGIILLSAENLRTGNVWRWFMRNREIPQAMNAIGLAKYTPRNRIAKPLRQRGSSPTVRKGVFTLRPAPSLTVGLLPRPRRHSFRTSLATAITTTLSSAEQSLRSDLPAGSAIASFPQ